ncbi:methionyl-tRNA formyltransferase [Mobilisporobacter senegalensis]|uniref:Methionyl-tRNA formyltransferase n=1 Tax=Mobilisporobacter senegalensis TaxID=1329262 RepID=A0A3N1XVU2_9FIRM|nr:methionyl-tRNA formyltransferase [Mobilisporobacter senegalensis]ROR30723.1 methionyl-tRNA formyltransferase [Mobilisporobacter senegalensis]
MKVVFMGTPDFSVSTLEEIMKAGHEVIAVVTQPDKPKGRGKSVAYPPVKEKALEYNIPVYQPVKAREESFIEILKELEPDVIVVVAFGQILPKAILDLPKYGCINVHASLLPKYRGAAPIQWSIIGGEKVTGITTMYMDVGIDTGDMLLQEEVSIDNDETGGSLHDKLSQIGGKLLVETLKRLEDGTVDRIKQDDSKSNYVKMLDKALGQIDFNKSAGEIERLIRGLNPWPSAYTSLEDKTLKVWRARVVEGNFNGRPGEIIDLTKEEIIVLTGKDALSILELQLEGKKRMKTDEFLRGYKIDIGTILG